MVSFQGSVCRVLCVYLQWAMGPRLPSSSYTTTSQTSRQPKGSASRRIGRGKLSYTP
jgi:hypothetical protein